MHLKVGVKLKSKIKCIGILMGLRVGGYWYTICVRFRIGKPHKYRKNEKIQTFLTDREFSELRKFIRRVCFPFFNKVFIFQSQERYLLLSNKKKRYFFISNPRQFWWVSSTPTDGCHSFLMRFFIIPYIIKYTGIFRSEQTRRIFF